MSIKVVVKNNNVEKALSIFKRKVKDSNLMYDLREREFYKKPSDVKKEAKSKSSKSVKKALPNASSASIVFEKRKCQLDLKVGGTLVSFNLSTKAVEKFRDQINELKKKVYRGGKR